MTKKSSFVLSISRGTRIKNLTWS